MDAAERARLEAVAYGADSDPKAAAEASRALAAERASTTVAPPDRAHATDPAPVLPSAPSTGSVPAPDPAGRRDTGRARRWRPVVLVAGVAMLAFALGVGTTSLLGRLPTAPATGGPRESTSELTVLARVLGRGQSPGDRLPPALRSGVVPSTSRLVFSNTSGGPTAPWSAWVVSTPAGDLCVVASPDDSEDTRSCMARSTAFDGTTTLVARSGSDVLTVIVSDGVVDTELAGRG